jgi:hypothetical protein
MTDQELRELVRDSIAKQLGGGHVRPHQREVAGPTMIDSRLHASHAVYQITRDAGDSEPCIIEPSVPCNHCNYCKSHGH